MFKSANAPNFEQHWYNADFLSKELDCEPCFIYQDDTSTRMKTHWAVKVTGSWQDYKIESD